MIVLLNLCHKILITRDLQAHSHLLNDQQDYNYPCFLSSFLNLLKCLKYSEYAYDQINLIIIILILIVYPQYN